MPKLPDKVIRFSRSKVVAIAALILTSLFCSISSSWPAAAMTFQNDLSELPITFPVQSPEVAAYFNQIARPQDIASISPSRIHLLPQDTAGQKMVAFRSWADAEHELETLIDQTDMVMYNPEHWELTPANEQQNLVTTVQQAAEFAHARGLRFMFAPDRRFAQAYLGEVAPYVDAVMLQGQRLQHDLPAFSSWILEMTSTARTANPEIQIWVQVGVTRDTPTETAATIMLAAIQTVSNDIDGIAIWSMPRSLSILQEFVTLLRESPPPVEATPPPTSTVAPTTVAPTESDVATSTPASVAVPSNQSRVATSTPDEMTAETSPPTVVPASPTPSPQMEQDAQADKWLETIALIVGSIVIGLLLGFGLGRKQRRG